MIFQYYVCYFDKIPFYQNLSIEKFNILIENKIHGKLGFDIDNIMRKSQFVGTRRTQVVHHIHFMVLVLVKIKKLHSITLSLTKCAFLVTKCYPVLQVQVIFQPEYEHLVKQISTHFSFLRYQGTHIEDCTQKCLPQSCLPVGKSEVGIIIITHHQKCLPYYYYQIFKCECPAALACDSVVDRHCFLPTRT